MEGAFDKEKADKVRPMSCIALALSRHSTLQQHKLPSLPVFQGFGGTNHPPRAWLNLMKACDRVPKVFTVCRVIAQEPVGRVVLTRKDQVGPEELARLCRAIHLDPSVLASCPDWVRSTVR